MYRRTYIMVILLKGERSCGKLTGPTIYIAYMYQQIGYTLYQGGQNDNGNWDNGWEG